MRYEWDDTKNAYNIIKHGFDFADTESFDWDKAIIFEDVRNEILNLDS